MVALDCVNREKISRYPAKMPEPDRRSGRRPVQDAGGGPILHRRRNADLRRSCSTLRQSSHSIGIGRISVLKARKSAVSMWSKSAASASGVSLQQLTSRCNRRPSSSELTGIGARLRLIGRTCAPPAGSVVECRNSSVTMLSVFRFAGCAAAGPHGILRVCV